MKRQLKKVPGSNPKNARYQRFRVRQTSEGEIKNTETLHFMNEDMWKF